MNSDDVDDELDSLDISAIREKLHQLQDERERRRESSDRLQEKLKALNYELASRMEEAETQRKLWQEVTDRNARLAEQRRHEAGTAVVVANETEADMEQVRRLMEQHLGSLVSRNAPRNELGIRLFDERDLMVVRPLGRVSQDSEEKTKEGVDTVLITHFRSAASEHKYHLSYRIGEETTVRKLREDACMYWGISEVEYILWTISNCKLQDDMLVRTCFKPDEEAHLILALKTPKKVEPPERVAELIRPKIGPKKAQVRKRPPGAAAGENADADPRQGRGNFYEKMAEMPGLFAFMTQRDREVKAHLKRVRPGACLLYLSLTVLTLISFLWVNPPDKEYYCRLGVFETLGNSGSVAFEEIRSEEQIWTWLEESVAAQFFTNTSELRQANLLLGNLKVWVQRVRSPSNSKCPHRVPTDIACLDQDYDKWSASSIDQEALKTYWNSVDGLDGRINGTRPWQYLSPEQGAARGLFGETATLKHYDSSGYLLAYDLQYLDLEGQYKAFLADLAQLKWTNWLSERSRSLQVAFSAYNPNYDFWVLGWFMLELPANGIVFPFFDTGLYRGIYQASTDIGLESLVVDIIRFVLIFLVLFYEAQWQARFKMRKVVSDEGPKSSWWSIFWYCASWRGLCDLGCSATFLAIFFERYVTGAFRALNDVEESTLQTIYKKSTLDAFRSNVLAEAVLFGFGSFRLLSLFQLNRTAYVIWKTLGMAVRRYIRFLLVLGPLLVGFILLAQTVWQSDSPLYRSFWVSSTSVFMALLGDSNSITVDSATRPITTVYLLVFYSSLSLLCINTWIAVLVHEYQVTRVTAGFRQSDYAWGEYQYASWLLPGPCLRGVYLRLRPGARLAKDGEAKANAEG